MHRFHDSLEVHHTIGTVCGRSLHRKKGHFRRHQALDVQVLHEGAVHDVEVHVEQLGYGVNPYR